MVLELPCKNLFEFLAEETKSSSLEDIVIMGCICPQLWNLRTFKSAIHEFSKDKDSSIIKLTRAEVFTVLATSMEAKTPTNDVLGIAISRIFRENQPPGHNYGFTCRETADLM